METANAVSPYISYSDSLKELRWNQFYNSIINKGKGMDKVISLIEHILDFGNEENTENIFMDVMDDNNYVSNGKIFSHLYSHIIQAENSAGIPKEDHDARLKFEWNTTSNLLRGLKTIKNNEPTYLLPKEDQIRTSDFIEILRFAPIEERYF
jgi:hypothetical protein